MGKNKKTHSIMSQEDGFTLIELVVVMAIIAVLATLVVGAIKVARDIQTDTQRRSDVKNIRAGFEAWYAHNKSYPDTSISPWNGTGWVIFSDAEPALEVKPASSADCGGGGWVYYDGREHSFTIRDAQGHSKTGIGYYMVIPYDASDANCNTLLPIDDWVIGP